MAFFQDAVEEFKKLPTGGKIAIGGIVVLVGYLGYRAYEANAASNAASQQASAADTSGTNSGYASVPGPGGSSIPILPSGLTPLFDANGNLIGWQQTGQGTTPPVTPPTSTGGGSSGSGSGSQNPFFSNAQISQQGSNFFLVQGSNKINLSSLFPKGTQFFGGGGGRAWYQLPGSNTKQLLVSKGYGKN
jgi:hypothetical protein